MNHVARGVRDMTRGLPRQAFMPVGVPEVAVRTALRQLPLISDQICYARPGGRSLFWPGGALPFPEVVVICDAP